MIRFLVFVLMVLMSVVPVSSAHAQTANSAPSPDHPFRIAMILWRGETKVEEGFRSYFHSRNIPVDFQVYNIDRNIAAIPDVIAQIRKNPPDLVYTWGTGVTMATVGRYDDVDPVRNISEFPVVFVMVSAPWKTGIAAPVGQTRPNVTGASHIAPLAAQINAIRAYRPMSHLGVVYNLQESNSVSNIADLKLLGEEMSFEVLAAPLGQTGEPDPARIPQAVTDLAKKGADFLYIGPDNFIGTYRDVLTDSGFANGLGTFSATELEVREGHAMFGLVSHYDLVGRLAASKAAAILMDGARPGDLPIETLNRFSYLIRLSAAQRLKLYPPLPLLDYAEIVQ
ncbi:ABC transporter substrate-binding protein [Thalassospira mesophila]|uniref:ABC transporter substrate-binding protein n=1 Tax=Thalassospira mesophila TaxID=1293891 RepID=UPI000A1D6960|nr:ABC transporter substrate-binding protein [Thalassospira mesophila]